MRNGWVVPPRRRLISIASDVHRPSDRLHDEVEREPAEDALLGQHLSDPERLGRDQTRVPGVGGEAAAEVGLPGPAAENLVVGGEQLDLAEEGHPDLDGRAAQLLAADPLLDDPCAFGQLVEEPRHVDALVLERHAEDALPRTPLPPSSPAGGRPVRSTSAFPAPATPSLSFTIAAVARGAPPASRWTPRRRATEHR